jgi:SAM-dependent methyltransferase
MSQLSSIQPRLLPEAAVLATSPVDHPDWNYRPVLRRVQLLRFRMILALLGERRYSRLLEIGYGSGVFMPELAARCAELHGIDPHPNLPVVASNLAGHGVPARLARGSAESMPYPTGYFDCVVAVSCLEFVPAIDRACKEIARVLAPGGVLAVVTPGATPLWNLALRIATREGPGQYGDRRRELQPALRRHLQVTREVRIPRLGGRAVRLYTGLALTGE